MAEWVNGPLPNDPARLAKVCQMSAKRFAHNFKNVSPKFVQNSEGYLINLRLEETREEQRKYSESRSSNVKKRWDRKDTYVSTHEIHSTIDTAYPSSSTSLKDINTLVVSPANNDCPHQKIISLYHDILPGLPQVRVWTAKRQKMLKSRWVSSKEYQDIEWWKEFFEYVRDKCPHLTGNNSRQWTADLEWLITEGNFIKTVEGRYMK